MKIKQAIIPKGYKRRPQIAMNSTYITIHNTGCPNVPADNFRRSCLDKSQDKEVSWHFTVDEKEIVQHIPTNEVAWHAGNRKGNYCSIGIEVCERDGAEDKAIELVKHLMKEHNIPLKNVVTHKSWSGKQCPHLILPHWDSFIKKCGEKDIVEDKQLADAVRKIQSKLKIDATMWSSVDAIQPKYVPALISKMGGLSRLSQERVISDTLLWEKKCYNKNHVRSLIIKYAALIG